MQKGLSSNKDKIKAKLKIKLLNTKAKIKEIISSNPEQHIKFIKFNLSIILLLSDLFILKKSVISF